MVARTAQGDHPTWRDADLWLDIGIGVVSYLEAVISDLEWGYYVTMTLLFSIDEGRYTVQSVEIGVSMEVDLANGENLDEGLTSPPVQEITSVLLRKVRVAEMTRLAASAGIFVKLDREDPPASLQDWYGVQGEPDYTNSEIGQTMVRRVEEGHLGAVAFSYQLARISGQPPAKAVERHFGCSARTATNWIAAARNAGLIVEQPMVVRS